MRLDRHQLLAVVLAVVLLSAAAVGIWYIFIQARGPAVQAPLSLAFEPGDESLLLINGTETRFDFRVGSNVGDRILTYHLEFNLTAIGSDFLQNVTGYLGDQVRVTAGQTLTYGGIIVGPGGLIFVSGGGRIIVQDGYPMLVLGSYPLVWTHAGSSWTAVSQDFMIDPLALRWFGLYILARFSVNNAEYSLTITAVVL